MNHLAYHLPPLIFPIFGGYAHHKLKDRTDDNKMEFNWDKKSFWRNTVMISPFCYFYIDWYNEGKLLNFPNYMKVCAVFGLTHTLSERLFESMEKDESWRKEH